jgi:IS30 family transposase
MKSGLSPELISGRLKLDGECNIHHETIYRMIYSKDYQHLNLWEYLSKAHKKRRNRHKRQGGRSNIPYRVSIHQRPEEINNRSEFGHWEADSVFKLKEWNWWYSNTSRTHEPFSLHPQGLGN